MGVEAWKAEAEKTGERAVAAAQEVTTRGAAYAKEQVSDLAKQGQRLAREADGQIKQYTGRPSEAWIGDASRLIKNHPWTAVALVAAVLYVLGKLRA